MNFIVRNVTLSLLLLLVGFTNHTFAATGGPDSFGYTYIASTDAGGPTYNWIELSPDAGGSGTPVGDLLDDYDDGSYYGVPLGFNFNFYGQTYNTLAVASNGTVYFEDDYIGYSSTCPMPDVGSYTPQTYIAHFWSDLILDRTDFPESDILYQNFGTYTVIEYYHVSAYDDQTRTSTWEIILYDNGKIVLQYQDVADIDDLGDYVVGIQGDPTTGLQYGTCETSGIVSDNLAIQFSPPCVLPVDLGADVTQCAAPVTLDAGFPGDNYIWSDGSTNQTFDATASGTYSVTVSDGAGCTGVDTVNVTLGSIVVDLGPDTTLCTASNITLDAGNPGATYSWSTGATTQTITIGATGQYSVTVSATGGCTATDTINVIVGTPISVDLGPDTAVCGGTGPVTLDAGNSGATYNWSTNETTQTINVNTAGTYDVTVSNGTCSATDEAVVYYSTPPTTTNYSTCAGYTMTPGQGLQAVNNCPVVTSQATSFTGSLDATDNTFHRSTSGTTYDPSAVGDAVYYDTYTFTVSVTGTYIFDMCGASNYDAFSSIYDTSFDPQNPANNFLQADDDGGTGCSSGPHTEITLTAGQTYVYVATEFEDGTTGSYTVTFSGPGTVSSAVVTPMLWFTGPTGGSSIGTGEVFNPVGVAGSGLPDLSTPGNYFYYVACTNSPNCRSVAVFIVNPSPIINLGNDTTICGGTVTLDAGNAGANSYNWSTGETTQTISVSTTDNYSVTVTTNGCDASGHKQVTVNTPPVIASVTTNHADICIGDSAQLSASATVSGLQPISFSNNNQISIPDDDANGITSSVTVSGIDPNTIGPNTIVSACVDITHTYDGDLEILLISPSGDSIYLSDREGSGAEDFTSTCFTADATTPISSGTGPYSGSFAPDDAFSGLTGDPNGTWTLKVNDQASGDVGTLNHWTLTLNNTGSPVYSWSPTGDLSDPNIANPVASPTATTTYTVTVTDTITGCASTDTVTVNVNQPPTVALGADISQCTGPVTLDAGNAGATYFWSDASTDQTLVVNNSGTYSVTVTNSSGCSAADTIDVAFTAITVDLGNDTTICTSLTLDAGNPGSTYLWSDNSTDQTLMVSAGGTYSVTVTSGAGCTATDDIVVTMGTTPVLNLPANIDQCGGTVTLDAENPGSTYVWTDNSTNQTLDVTQSGAYGVVVTSADGCTATGASFVTINTPPTVSLGNDTAICGGTLTLDADNAGSTYLWSDNSTAQTLVVDQTGTYGVTVTDVNGCSATDDFQLTVNTPPTVNLGNDTTICGGTLTLDAGNAGSTYLWSDNSTAQTLALSQSGTVDVTVTDINGCSATDDIQVTVNTPPTVSLGNDTAICGGTLTLDAGNAGATYLWNDNSTAQTLVADQTGTIGVTVTDGNGCTATDNIQLTVNTPPTVALGNDTTVCGSITLDAGNTGSNYVWSDNSAAQTLVVSQTGTIDVTVTDTNGCLATDDIVVTVKTIPTVDLGADTTICNDTLVLDAGNIGATYLWDDNSTNQTLEATATGYYSITVTDSNGCSATDSVLVTLGAITVDLGTDVTTCEPDTLDAGNPGATYLWSTGDTTQTIFTPDDNNVSYSVTVTLNGCVATDTFIEGCEGIDEAAFGSVQLFPNPNDGHFQLVLQQSNASDLNIEITNVAGQKIWAIEHVNATGSYTKEIDLAAFAKGVYFVRLTSKNSVTVRRVVIQ